MQFFYNDRSEFKFFSKFRSFLKLFITYFNSSNLSIQLLKFKFQITVKFFKTSKCLKSKVLALKFILYLSFLPFSMQNHNQSNLKLHRNSKSLPIFPQKVSQRLDNDHMSVKSKAKVLITTIHTQKKIYILFLLIKQKQIT